jgi:L-ascorbate metabolism protein UlaG (beta-lactamase superfamily)
MELQFYGANCVKISTKKATVVVDDNLKQLGQKSISKPGDINIFTFFNEQNEQGLKDPKIVIQTAGEYEISGVSIKGVSARSHMDEEDKKTAVIYKIIAGDLNVVVAGHIHPDLSEQQLETLGVVDVLFVPVGGNGYTLDAIGALKIIKKFEPKIIIPTHYDDKSLKFEVPQTKLEDVMKEITFEIKERVPKIKLKSSDLPELTEFVVLEKQ